MLKLRPFLLIMTFFAISRASCLELLEVRALEMSSTKNTITLNRGEIDNYKDHDHGKLYLQLGDQYSDKENPKIYLVAEGELVKNFPTKSYWHLKKISMPNLINEQAHFLLLNTTGIRQGRHDRIITRKHIVFPESEYNNIDQYIDKNKNAIPEKLILEQNEFTKTADLYKEVNLNPADISIVSHEKLKKKNTSELNREYADDIADYYFVGPTKVSLVDILNADDQKLLESMSKQYLTQNANLKYGLSSGVSSSDVHQDIDPRLIAKIKRDGVTWSDDMDDATLRRYFISAGVVTERNRRERVLNEREGHEFILHYAGSLSDHTTPIDQYNRALGYDLGIAYDLHLSRINPSLRSWSLQFLLDWGVSHYNLGPGNGNSQEVLYGTFLNYYFYNSPLSLNKFIYALGLGVAVGQSHMSNVNLLQQYSYQIMTIPVVQLLAKYRFHIGDTNQDNVNIGTALNAGLIFERKRLSLFNVPADGINGVITVNNIKLQLGMGFYF